MIKIEEKTKQIAPNARNARVDLLKKAIEDAKLADQEISKQKVCALMSIEHGVSENKVLEYLELFERAGLVKIEGDIVTPL